MLDFVGGASDSVHVERFHVVKDDLLDALNIRAGDSLDVLPHAGELSPGRVYIVREHEGGEAVARVYAGGRFETASTDPDLSHEIALDDVSVEGMVAGVARRMF